MRRVFFIIWMWILGGVAGYAQSMYGDAVKADVKMKYVYSFEEALELAKKENKLIFFNCFSDWALPCHGMNKLVFSDQKFADWMNKHFVNLLIDVSKPEGRPLADKYDAHVMAHYLILDKDGNVVHRIVGGCPLPEFQERVAKALSTKTSLAGMTKSYDAGKRNVKFLHDYASVLRYANEKERYEKVADEYFAKLKKSEWPQKENWQLFSDQVQKAEGEMFHYLVVHKAEFVKQSGDTLVNNKISNLYFREIYPMATGSKAYDGDRLLSIYMDLEKAAIPKDYVIYTVYDIAKYRGEKKFDKMMEVFENKVPYLDKRTASGLDLSLKSFKEISEKEKKRIETYFHSRMQGLSGSVLEAYQSVLKEVVNPEGIPFIDISLTKALEKAKKEGKLIFLDCYTSWCGPCKMMSKQVFSQKYIGEFFKEHFISVKIDMEREEGEEIAQKYEVKAYPTMLILDTDGSPLCKLLGGMNARTFMKKIKRGMNEEVSYALVKRKYAAGERSVNFMPDYFITLANAGEIKETEKKVNEFLISLKGKDCYLPEVWKLYEEYVNNMHLTSFDFLVDHWENFSKTIGKESVMKKIEEVVFPVYVAYLNNPAEKSEKNFASEIIHKAKFPSDFSLVYLDKIVRLYDESELDRMLDFYEKEVYGIKDARVRLNLDVLLKELLQDATDIQKRRALAYARKCQQHADPKALRGYNNLLEALSE